MSQHLLTCAECKGTFPDWLGTHLVDAHGMGVPEYLQKHPTSQVVSFRVKDATVSEPRRSHPTRPADLTVCFSDGGMPFRVNAAVPAEACLPAPDHYKLPVHGELGRDVRYALVALHRKRSLYIWGEPGTGKDALIHEFAAKTRTPSIIKQIVPGTDIESWFFSRAFDEHGTSWEEGDVLKAIRDGYLCEDGTRVPYLILLSDMDRALKDQAEYMRLLVDSISGRVQGPAGKVYPVCPGTLFVATANTSGGGDTTGRHVSSNPLDASLLNRWNYKLQFHQMEWKDEEEVLKAKFPMLAVQAPNVFDTMGEMTKAMRIAINNRTIYGEMSHRDVCHILMAAEDLLTYTSPNVQNAAQTVLSKAVRVWLDGLPDPDTRQSALNIFDSQLGSALPSGGRRGGRDLMNGVS